MSTPTLDQLDISKLIENQMVVHHLDANELASQCKVTYQTVKNALAGKSVSATFASALIDQFSMRDDPTTLRNFLLGFLLLQFENYRGEELLRQANLMRTN